VDLVIGADGLARCGWGGARRSTWPTTTPEWAGPCARDDGLFERLNPGGVQSGLSWLTIRASAGIPTAFDSFSIPKVAGYGDADARD